MGKPVLLTRVVDTMVHTPRPTRAEATDVANAVLDGVDGIVLGAETLRGSYPVDTVKTVSSICRFVWGSKGLVCLCWQGARAVWACFEHAAGVDDVDVSLPCNVPCIHTSDTSPHTASTCRSAEAGLNHDWDFMYLIDTACVATCPANPHSLTLSHTNAVNTAGLPRPSLTTTHTTCT